MSKNIHSVLGELHPEALGFTQCHEHIMLTRGRSWEINKDLCIDESKKSEAEVNAYKAAGGASIVEAQPGGCNRDPDSLEKISKQTGVNIIASTGFHKMQFYPKDHWIFKIKEEGLAELFISELTEGMCVGIDKFFTPRRHKAKAGIIKTALDSCNLAEPYGRLFRAAAYAQTHTGSPLMVHIEKGSSPQTLIEFLKSAGADLEKVYFCHMDRACSDADSLKKVLDSGISLEFDTIGRPKYHDDFKELELIRFVLEEGGEDQLLFSLDTTRARLKVYTPDAVGLDYILKVFIPMMLDAGISEKQIRKISVDNPARILAW